MSDNAYVEGPTPKQIAEPAFYDAIDAISLQRCPKCGSWPRFNCQSEEGLRVWPPHQERIDKVTEPKMDAAAE